MILNVDTKQRHVIVSSLADVAGATPAIPPAAFDAGWVAFVQNGIPAESGRVFIVRMDPTANSHVWTEVTRLPDQQYTVGVPSYQLHSPGTYDQLQGAIDAASLGDFNSGVPAGVVTRRVVSVLPGVYELSS